MPPAASPPVFTVISPILTDFFCATAGFAICPIAAAALVAARNLRRLIFLATSSSVGRRLLPGARVTTLPSLFVCRRARRGPRRRPSSRVFGLNGSFGFCPVARLRLGGFEIFRGLEAGRHRSRRARQHLMVLVIEKPQPALLPQREPDHAAELDQFRLREVALHAFPKI